MSDGGLKIHTQYTLNQCPINLEHHTVFYYWGYHSKQVETSFCNVERKCITQWDRIKSIKHQMQPNSYHYLFWCYLY